MVKRKRKLSSISATESIDVTFGVFNVSEYRVPFATALLRFQQVAEYLNLVTDNPKYARQDWSIEELFQRDVDQARVIDIADNYLNPNSNRPQFFNSLTVVLNPLTDIDSEYFPPEDDNSFNHNLKIGPILISYDDIDPKGSFPRNNSIGCIRWNRAQVYAVAIDGQHRLAALKHFYQNNPIIAANSSISVIFIIIDPKIGFIAPEMVDSTKFMRSIFIDLNKHAVPVSRARNLLLDDNDPTAQFVRKLFGPSLNYVATNNKTAKDFNIGTNDEFLECLPLELVDWHGESKSKIEQGPYVTSVLALEWIVKQLFKNRFPKQKEIPARFNPDDYDDGGYYTKIFNILSTWEKTWPLISGRWEECKETESVFNLNNNDIIELSNEFRKLWGPAITRLLTTAGPYYDLAIKRLEFNTINPQFGQWCQARAAMLANSKKTQGIRRYYADRFDAVKDELKNSGIPIAIFENTLETIEDEIKNDSIFFFLVGQRALVIALTELVGSGKGPDWAINAGIDLESFKDCIQDFYAFYLVEAINAIHKVSPRKKGVFYKECKVDRDKNELTTNLNNAFWAGSIVRRDDPDQIDFSEMAAIRGSKWFVLIAHLFWFIKCNSSYVDHKKLIAVIDKTEIIQDLKFGKEVLDAVGKIYGGEEKNNYAPMSFLSGTFEIYDPEVAKTAGKERIRKLAKVLGSYFAQL